MFKLRIFSSTVAKIRIANLLYRLTQLVRIPNIQIISRGGITYEVDLREGIDLSLYYFGSFQKHIIRSLKPYLASIPQNCTVFDVGANFGLIGLSLAQAFQNSQVYMFEPSTYAFQKLQRNISLNKNMHSRLFPVQTFIGSESNQDSTFVAFSSWRVDHVYSNNNDQHPIHMGLKKEAPKNQISLDDFARENKIDHVHLIKIDTEGYEFDVLKGATSILAKYKPIVIFELSLYQLADHGLNLSHYEDLFLPLGYRLINSETSQLVTKDTLEQIPEKGGIDVLAIPSNLVTKN